MALQLAGASSCPVCTSNYPPLESGFGHTVIYRRSDRSITFRCKKCGAQWTMTFANLHKVLSRHIASSKKKVHPWYDWVVRSIAFAAKAEKRGRPRKGRRKV